MLRHKNLLVSLVLLIDQLPGRLSPAKRRGRPKTYSDRLILKALVIMIIRRLYTAYALLTFLAQDDDVARQVRRLLHEQGCVPTRRTWERRLACPSICPADRLLWVAPGRGTAAVGAPAGPWQSIAPIENQWWGLAQEA